MTVSLSDEEIRKAKEVYYSLLENSKENKKTIVIQPYGSSAMLHSIDGVIDNSLRSMTPQFLDKLIDRLSKKYNLIYFGPRGLVSNSKIMEVNPDPNLREWCAVIKMADYFIGCDSSGQHMAKSVGQDASVVVAGTSKINMTYPNTFHILERECDFHYSPMRISSKESEISERLNMNRIKFTDEEFESFCKEVEKRVDNKPQKVFNFNSKKISDTKNKINKSNNGRLI